MKRKIIFRNIIIIVVFLFGLCSLTSCNNYDEIELTKENFYDYFTRLESGDYDTKEIIDDFTFAENDDGGLSAKFIIKQDSLENNFFSNVSIGLQINLYYDVDKIIDGMKPTHSMKYTSNLVYNDCGDYITYTIGGLLTYGTFSYQEKSGNNVESTDYKIQALLDDYELTGYKFSNYYREIKILTVSGKVETGGLTAMNEYHCQ